MARRLAFLLIIVVSLAAAVGSNETMVAPSIDLAAPITPIRLSNETLAAAPARLPDGSWAYLVYLNGSPSALVRAAPGLLGWEARLLTDGEEIRQTLAQYYREQDAAGAAGRLVEDAHRQVQAFNRSRGGEQACRQLMGSAEHACDDFSSCQKTCYASTSFCRPIALAEGAAFVMRIWAYENVTKNLSMALEGEPAGYAYAQARLTPASIADYRRALTMIEQARDIAAAHPFHGTYCKTPAYDNASLRAAKQNLTLASNLLLPAAGRNQTALAIANATGWRMEEKKKRAEMAAGRNSATPAPEDCDPNAAKPWWKQITDSAAFAAFWPLLAVAGAVLSIVGVSWAGRLLQRGKTPPNQEGPTEDEK